MLTEAMFSTAALFTWLGMDQALAFWIVAGVVGVVFVALVIGMAIGLQREGRDYDC